MRKISKAWGGIGLLVVAGFLIWFWRDHAGQFDTEGTKSVFVQYGSWGSIPVPVSVTFPQTVEQMLEKQGIVLNENDQVWPHRDENITAGMQVTVLPARAITVTVEGESKEIYSAETTVSAILAEAQITVGENDIVTPAMEAVPGGAIDVVRVTVKEETIDEKIPFETKVEEDSSLSFRVTKVKQAGVSGTKTTKYKVSYHNDKEVAREVLEETITKEPTAEITAQGTKVTVKKKHTGAASWYAYTGTLSAANPWLPLGSYVRVTNTENSKSVIVKINDRGPFGPGRIIDLDKVAFAQIASLGTGVVNVIMEEIE